jgi:rubredoxin
MKKYVCSICGYVYDPSEGDPNSDIPPGTPFEKLSSDWTCPDCGAPISSFDEE